MTTRILVMLSLLTAAFCSTARASESIPLTLTQPVNINDFDTVTQYCLGAMAKEVATQKIPNCVAIQGLGSASCAGEEGFGPSVGISITINGQNPRRIVLYHFPGGDFGTFAYHSLFVNETVFNLPRGQEFPYFKYDVQRNIHYGPTGQYLSEDDFATTASIQVPMDVSGQTTLKSAKCDDPQGMQDGKCSVTVNTSRYLQCLQSAFADMANTNVKTCEIAEQGLGASAQMADSICQH